jgi:hypothetical protein
MWRHYVCSGKFFLYAWAGDTDKCSVYVSYISMVWSGNMQHYILQPGQTVWASAQSIFLRCLWVTVAIWTTISFSLGRLNGKMLSLCFLDVYGFQWQNAQLYPAAWAGCMGQCSVYISLVSMVGIHQLLTNWLLRSTFGKTEQGLNWLFVVVTTIS